MPGLQLWTPCEYSSKNAAMSALLMESCDMLADTPLADLT